ncbi:MAG TPA: DinB family protein [Kineosporiaceae bacterium]|nr:DinB family protein [Kineosporiaceae bacterium]
MTTTNIWTAPTPGSPGAEPLVGPDRPILESFLDWHRRTLLNICAGLTGEQLAARSIPPSNLSLLGLVRHLAKVERTWFRERVAGQPVGPLFDPERGKDADFDDLDPSAAENDFAVFERECRLADEAVAGLSFDDTFELRGETYSLRLVYVHLIAEYARHNGHADLLRERIDGKTGS